MKLLMHSFNFEECTLTFSVPKEIMNSRGFGNVPGGVEVDLADITKDASLGIAVAQNSTSNNTEKNEILTIVSDVLNNDYSCEEVHLRMKHIESILSPFRTRWSAIFEI